jgi:hypothetical protein
MSLELRLSCTVHVENCQSAQSITESQSFMLNSSRRNRIKGTVMVKCFSEERDEARFQVLTAASMKVTSFWDIAPCSLVEVYRRFRGEY